jgi:hypothetical protein
MATGAVIDFDYSANFTGGKPDVITRCMTMTTASLNALMLLLFWQSQPGTTYTVQTSADLQEWAPLPFVIEGTGGHESFPIERDSTKVFARLRYSGDGDTNENGLPDMWEWQQFGYIDIDPYADPDGDGYSTYMEWVQSTHPLDFYNGDLPVIHLSSGRQWNIPSGEISLQALSIQVTHRSGEPWGNAPVSIQIESGNEGLVNGNEPSSSAVTSMVLSTDSLGRIQPEILPLHILGPTPAGAMDEVVIAAGRAEAHLIIHSTGPDFGQPPRQLLREVNEEGQLTISWTGPVAGASEILFQELDGDGKWIDFGTVSAANLPLPDTETGRFLVVLDPLPN